MKKSPKLVTEDLYRIDWSKFNCHVILEETNNELKIICKIQANKPHTVLQVKSINPRLEERDNIIGI